MATTATQTNWADNLTNGLASLFGIGANLAGDAISRELTGKTQADRDREMIQQQMQVQSNNLKFWLIIGGAVIAAIVTIVLVVKRT